MLCPWVFRPTSACQARSAPSCRSSSCSSASRRSPASSRSTRSACTRCSRRAIAATPSRAACASPCTAPTASTSSPAAPTKRCAGRRWRCTAATSRPPPRSARCSTSLTPTTSSRRGRATRRPSTRCNAPSPTWPTCSASSVCPSPWRTCRASGSSHFTAPGDLELGELGFVLDCGHAAISGTLDAFLTDPQARLAHVHLHSNFGPTDTDDPHRPLGEGVVERRPRAGRGPRRRRHGDPRAPRRTPRARQHRLARSPGPGLKSPPAGLSLRRSRRVSSWVDRRRHRGGSDGLPAIRSYEPAP